MDHALGLTTLRGVRLQPVETLSKGFKRRVGLAQALLHDPPVLVLDEPTDGLDPNQKHEVRGLIAQMAPDKAIVISTHILEEVDAVCTRAIIIAGGRIVADETPQALVGTARVGQAGGRVPGADDGGGGLMALRRRDWRTHPPSVMAGRRPAIHALQPAPQGVDGGPTPGHDADRWPYDQDRFGMNAILIIAGRELRAYFATPVATVFIVIFLVLQGALTFNLGQFFDRGIRPT